jgi:hypothetical protein
MEVTTTKRDRRGKLDPSWLIDPVRFFELCWPGIRLYDKQVELLYSCATNIETFCHAGNELGKDFMAARIALWFYSSRRPSKVLTTSASEDQLELVLWAEMREAIKTSRLNLSIHVDHLRVRRKDKDGEYEPNSFIKGKVARKGEGFQGFHLSDYTDKPRVMTIIDEGSGVADEHYEAAQSFSDVILVIGNPMNNTNFFYFGCRKGDEEDPAGGSGLLRKVIHVGDKHSPNVRLAEEEIKLGKKPSNKIIIPGVIT